MATLNFKTFANSPKSMSKLPSKLHTQHSFSPKPTYNPYTNIPQLKKQMQEAINSKKSIHSNAKKIHNKYPSQISLMKSDISLLSTILTTPDLPLNLLELQVGFTEEILALREDKLTIMEEHNKILSERYKLQRELAKLKKRQEKQRQSASQINELMQLQKQNSSGKKKIDKNQVIFKNQRLRMEYQQLEGQRVSIMTQRDEQEQYLNQIENICQSARIIEQKLNKLESNTRREEDEQRFETFFPNKKQGKITATPNQMRQVRKLRQKKMSLLRTLASMTFKVDLKKYFNQLINENQFLSEKNDCIVFDVNELSSNQKLKQRVANEEEQKLRFYSDLRKFKQQVDLLKQQNDQLRKKIGSQAY